LEDQGIPQNCIIPAKNDSRHILLDLNGAGGAEYRDQPDLVVRVFVSEDRDVSPSPFNEKDGYIPKLEQILLPSYG
jgi:hypothetical protein